MQTYVLTGYVIYIGISVAVCIWVGRTLHRNGRIFLIDACRGREELADSINHLLLVGFYLVNIGYISFAVRFGAKPTDWAGVLELASTKVGLVLLILGAMHFFNLYVFNRLRKRGHAPHLPDPEPIDETKPNRSIEALRRARNPGDMKVHGEGVQP